MKNVLALAVVVLLAASAFVPAADPPADKVAALIEDLRSRDESVKLNAALALGKAGKAAVDPVAAVLTDPDTDVRYYAVWALGLLGPDAKGRTADIIRLLDDRSADVRRKAAFAIGRIAPPDVAVPVLIKVLADDNADVRTAAVAALAGFDKEAVPALADALKSPHPRICLHAAQALGQIGPAADAAVPALTPLLASKEKGIGTEARGALARFGKVALPALIKALNSEDFTLRRRAVQAIAEIDDAEAVQALLDALKSPFADVRAEAASALSVLPVADKRLLLSLAELLVKDEDVEVRRQAMLALTGLPGGLQVAMPALKTALADDHNDIRGSSYAILGNAGVDADEVLAGLMQSKDLRRRVNATALHLALGKDRGGVAADALAAVLTDKDRTIRYQAAFGLASAGTAPGRTLDVLIEALKDDRASIREQAVASLYRVGKVAGFEKGLPPLIERLKDESPAVRLQAKHALAHLSRDASVVMPILAEFFKDEQHDVRRQALTAMFERWPEKGVPWYTEGLQDDSPHVRVVAARYLGLCGEPARKAVPDLATVAKSDSDREVRRQAMWALTNLGDEAVAQLAALLKVKDAEGQQDFLYTLLRAGPKAKPAVPALIGMLKSSDHEVRGLVARVLGAIGPDARDAVNALKEMATGDAHESVRTAAENALKMIQP